MPLPIRATFHKAVTSFDVLALTKIAASALAEGHPEPSLSVLWRQVMRGDEGQVVEKPLVHLLMDRFVTRDAPDTLTRDLLRLVACGLDLDEPLPPGQATVLHHAVDRLETSQVQALLAAGARVDPVGYVGAASAYPQTPLSSMLPRHWCEDSAAIRKLLIQHGANLDPFVSTGRSALLHQWLDEAAHDPTEPWEQASHPRLSPTSLVRLVGVLEAVAWDDHDRAWQRGSSNGPSPVQKVQALAPSNPIVWGALDDRLRARQHEQALTQDTAPVPTPSRSPRL